VRIGMYDKDFQSLLNQKRNDFFNVRDEARKKVAEFKEDVELTPEEEKALSYQGCIAVSPPDEAATGLRRVYYLPARGGGNEKGVKLIFTNRELSYVGYYRKNSPLNEGGQQ